MYVITVGDISPGGRPSSADRQDQDDHRTIDKKLISDLETASSEARFSMSRSESDISCGELSARSVTN